MGRASLDLADHRERVQCLADVLADRHLHDPHEAQIQVHVHDCTMGGEDPGGIGVALAAAHRHCLEDRAAGYHPGVLEMLVGALSIPMSQIAEAVAFRSRLRAEVRTTFAAAGVDALATPTTPRTTMPLASFDPATELGTLIPYTCPFNLTGQPAVSVPCGFTRSGLPIGLQLVGVPFDDAGLLRVATAYEQATTWHDYEPEVP